MNRTYSLIAVVIVVGLTAAYAYGQTRSHSSATQTREIPDYALSVFDADAHFNFRVPHLPAGYRYSYGAVSTSLPKDLSLTYHTPYATQLLVDESPSGYLGDTSTGNITVRGMRWGVVTPARWLTIYPDGVSIEITATGSHAEAVLKSAASSFAK